MLDIVTAPSTVLFQSTVHERSEVTIGTTLFNYSDFIIPALESARAQELRDIDLVVVDDGSTDGGPERVLEWMQAHYERFGRCLLLQHKANDGLAGARNQTFARALTPFVFVLDADNQIYPRCLEACLAAAHTSKAEAIYTLIEVFGPGHDGAVMGTDLWDPERLATHNYIDAMALVRKAAWMSVGGFRRMPVTGWEDYDFWLKFMESGFRAVRVPEILCRYRLHGGSMLRTVTNHPKALKILQHDMQLHHPSARIW